MIDSILALLDPAMAAKVIAVLAVLSALRGLVNVFVGTENKFAVWFGKVLDFIGYNPSHK